MMDKKGNWRLSPAYDLVYSYGEGVYKEHFLTLAGKRCGFTREDLTDAAAKFDISRKRALEMIEETNDTFSRFANMAKELELNTKGITAAYIT